MSDLEPFVLDRTENPHPRMLDEAVRARRATRLAPSDPEAAAYWRGYLDAMCGATGCPAEEIEAWMDRAAT